MKHIKLSKLARRSRLTRFHRCGVAHTITGANFEDRQFTAEEWARLEAEAMLEVTEVQDAEPDPVVAEQDLRSKIKLAITNLGEDEFTKKGVPQVGAVRAALPDHAEEITADLVASVWAEIPPAPPAEPKEDLPPPEGSSKG